MMDRKEILFKHSHLRLATRYGEELTQDLHDEISCKIKSRESPGIKITCRKYLVRLNHGDQMYYLLWDRKRQCIITFLTPEMYQRSSEYYKSKKKRRKK